MNDYRDTEMYRYVAGLRDRLPLRVRKNLDKLLQHSRHWDENIWPTTKAVFRETYPSSEHVRKAATTPRRNPTLAAPGVGSFTWVMLTKVMAKDRFWSLEDIDDSE